jgi:lipopolysaccharide heptosyltransferase II
MLRQVNAPAKLLDKWSGLLLGRFLGGLFRVLGLFGRPVPVKPPREILIVKFCCLGDAVLVVPSLRALRETFPSARLTMLCTPRTLPIFQDCEYLDEVKLFALTGSRGAAEFVTAGIPAVFRTLAMLRARRFDVVIDFDNYYNWTTFLGFLAGIPTRVGFDPPGQGRRFLLTNPVPYAGDRHMVEFYLDLPRAIGADTARREPALPVSSEAVRWSHGFLAGHGHEPGSRPLVALSPGRSEAWHFIRWSEENFVATGEALHREFGAQVLLVGGKSEVAIAERMADLLAARGIRAIDATGKSDLQQSKALLQQADLLVCNDSGPMHLSAAVGTPTLAVFGPANPHRWGPYGAQHRVERLELPCSPCLFMGKLGVCPAKELACLDVPLARVTRTAGEMLRARLARSASGSPA